MSLKFIHEQNYKTKIEGNYGHIGDKIEKFYTDEYLPLKEKLLKLDFSNADDKIFAAFTTYINDYIKKLHSFCVKNGITSQSKLESTFLEEISIYLFKDMQPIKDGSLGILNKNVYAGIKIEKGLSINIPKKDVDFCIGKEVSLGLDEEIAKIIIPIVAVEVKTYLDATMLGEIQYSSRVIRNAVPNAKTYVLTGYHVVGEDRISSARSDKSIDEIFVLQEKEGAPIEAEAIKAYFEQIESDIKKTTEENTVSVLGRLLAQ